MDELKMKYREITAYEPAEDLVLTHEESMETAIPEYCPDLARVVDASGCLRLREWSVKDGQLTISGSVFVTVLYTSEESAGLRSLTLSVPLSCRMEDKRDCQVLSPCGRLLLLEVKPLGARKLYIRALSEFRVGGFRLVQQKIAVRAEGGPDLQVLERTETLPLLRDVWMQEFPFAQEAAPEGSDGEAEDLLMARCNLHVTGCQRFGTKLVVKGDSDFSLLCRDADQHLRTRSLTLPFSQIIDRPEIADEGELYCQAQALEYEVHPVRTDNGSGYGVTMRIGLLISLYDQVPISYVADLYSTRYDMSVQRQTLSIVTTQMPETIHRDTVQRLEGAGGFAYLTDVDCTQPEPVTGEEEGVTLRSTVRMRVLYLDESGTPVIAERSAEVSGQVSCMPQFIRAEVEPALWQRISSGFEIRLPVVFILGQRGIRQLSSVLSAQQQEEIDRAAMPSLILRRLREGETLWEVACQCRTDEQAILAANGLTDGEDPGGRLLLIPKVR